MLKYLHNRLFFWVLPALLFSNQLLYAQAPDLRQKLSVEYTAIPLEKVLNDLSEKAKIRFSYSADLIPASLQITYRADQKMLEQILNDILNQAGIHFTLVNDYIVLKIKPVQLTEERKKPVMFTISGTISDSSSNEIMIGAAVYVKETGTGAISNNYGFYSLTLPSGTYNIQTSYLGYSPESRILELKANIRWNLRLRQAPLVMKEIIINQVNNKEYIFHSLAAQTNVDPSAVQQQSAALGETDMLKSLDNLPGISFQSDGSSFFNVRGGSHDQNLVLLDEAPVYNPSHLLGLFTPIIPEAIKHVEVYRADFPVQYGGRLSSVIDIRARDGNMSRFSGNASVSPVSTRFSLEGPLKKQASSYFVAFRISTFGLLVKAMNPSVENFYFADFTSKFNLKLGKRDRLYLTLFAGKDLFLNKAGSIRNGLEWENTTATFRWSHVYGNRLFSNTTFYTSKYDYSLYTDYDQKLFWNSDITGSNLKSEFSWYISPRNSLKFGVSAGGYFFNPGNYNSPDPGLDTMRVSKVNSGEVVIYAGHEIDLTHWLHLNYGIRLSNWSNYGEAFSIVYNTEYQPVTSEQYPKGVRYYTRSFLEPRISLSMKSGDYSSVKASYNRTTQNINQISNSISPFNSLEVWLPSGPNIKPQQADIIDLGYVKSWSAASLDLTMDIYYKKMYNQLGYSPHAEMFLNPYLEGEIRQGEGIAYGFEIMMRKTQGRFTGQIGYAFTRSYLKIKTLNGGKTYPSRQDKPVDFSFVGNYRVRPRWNLNMNIVYTSGMTLSTPTGFYDYRGTQVPVYAEQNNDRLPDYRRLDVGSTWRLNKKERAFSHSFTLTAYNLFSTHNYVFLNFNKVKGDDGKYYVPADKLAGGRQVITYRYIYSLVPSFTYSLKF